MRRSLPLLLVACAGSGVPDAFETPTTFTLAVSPATLEVQTGPDGAPPVPFSVTVTFADGTTAVPDAVAWSVSNRSAGSVDEAGVFTASTLTGGATWVTAELDGVTGQADVLVRYQDDVVVGDVDPAAFDGTDAPSAEDVWTYPPDGVNVPRNTPSLHLQWRAAGDGLYRLAFASAYTDITVYTDQPGWLADSDAWARIAATNAGGEVTARLSWVADGTVHTAPDRHVRVNRLDADGAIVYWSTSKAGLVQIPFGHEATDLFTEAQAGHCVGCHAISRDGLVAFTYDGGNGPLGLKHLDDLSDVVPYVDGGPSGNFSTFSPDGALLLTSSHGNLDLYDTATGAFLRTVYNGGDATHPDWSPDGTQLVFVRTAGHTNDWTLPLGTRLLTMPYLGDGVFGNFRTLVDLGEARNAYYPAWSPDGQWVAFNVSTGDCYDDTDAELWVVDPSGGAAPVRLDAANGPEVRTNSWPRWAPLPDDDVLWLAFASRRDYGGVTTDQPQIWVAAFDPAKARRGEDPSWPAFWLPSQDTTTANHIPVWVR
ncbi:MAG: PD40 domain-containing protein [Alphaproteobacteria bacterium]|nr:PD40 domain-containing protein [Alphaproteobacteria bacterium]